MLNLVGEKFGKLTVVSKSEKINGRTAWNCLCSCGETKVVRTGGLRQGTSSCGNCPTTTYEVIGKETFGYTKKQQKFVIDTEDYEKVKHYSWYTNSKGYLYAPTKDNTKIAMHRIIANANKDDVVDHIDGDPTNNRKSNLRICNHVQNGQNSRIAKDNKSGVTGVYWNNATNKWVASIRIDNKNVYLGQYIKKSDAVLARVSAEKKYYKEFRNTYNDDNIKSILGEEIDEL